MRRAAARYSCSGRLADDRLMSRLSAIKAIRGLVALTALGMNWAEDDTVKTTTDGDRSECTVPQIVVGRAVLGWRGLADRGRISATL